MKDKGAALSALGNQALFVNLTEDQERHVLALIAEIKAIFEHSIGTRS